MKAEENIDTQLRDSNRIFKAIISGNFENYDQAQQAVCVFWAPDPSISRAGISHALELLRRYYEDKSDD